MTAATSDMISHHTNSEQEREEESSDEDESFDIGEAAEGARYVVSETAGVAEGTHTAASKNKATKRTSAVPLSKLDPADTDAVRAAAMRAAQMRKANSRDNQVVLPGLPASASNSLTSNTPARTLTKSKLPRRTRLQKFKRCCQIFMQWRVLKHVISALILPVLTLIGLWIYSQQPSDISLPDALMKGDLHTVRFYIERESVPVNSPIEGDDQERTPLHFAALGNQTEVVQYLVRERHALLDLIDTNGFTPLHYACHIKNSDMTSYLLSVGAPIEAVDVNQRTPLHIAAIAGNQGVLASLIFKGKANLHARDIDQMYASDYSRIFHTSAMQQLLDDGYYYDAKGKMKIIAHEEFEEMKRREGVASLPKKKEEKQKVKLKVDKKPKQQPKDKSDTSKQVGGDEDEDDVMALFTGSAEEAALKQQRDLDAAAARAAQQRAAEEYASIKDTGEVDEDEFSI